jgi:DNA repair exonuclease SbcCD nuclease subunit
MILFTADWHIKLGQKNVPMAWACARYDLFFETLHELENDVDLHIIGGDLFDRVPSMDELTIYLILLKILKFLLSFMMVTMKLLKRIRLSFLILNEPRLM